MDLYAFEKMQHPEQVMVLRAFKRKDVDDVERLVQISRGNREKVESESDWAVLTELVNFYVERWPDEWTEFHKSMPDIRGTRRGGGYSESKEMKYLAAIPLRLERLIKAVFPLNQFNKDFSNKFVRRFKVFKVGGEGN